MAFDLVVLGKEHLKSKEILTFCNVTYILTGP